jgi:hypothetical protein
MAEKRVRIPRRTKPANPTTEQIMAKCPQEISTKDIPMVNKGGRPRTYGSGKNKWHSEEDRIKAATVFAMTGNALRTAEITGVPHGTIRQWKTQPWWPQVLERVHQEHDDELDAKITKVIEKTITQVEDRLDNGDYFYDIKTGEIQKVPMKGKEIAVVTSIMFDKRDNIRRRKQTHQDQQSIKESLKAIADAFRKMAGKPQTIEGEIIEISEETQAPDAGEGQETLLVTDAGPSGN